jgi:hypothetical protein
MSIKDATDAMNGRERFFYDNAGYSYLPSAETEEQGHINSAKALAVAEQYAEDRGWWCEWSPDECPGCDCEDSQCCCCMGTRHVSTRLSLWDEYGGRCLGSLGGICEPSTEYRRVVRAELALDAMPAEAKYHS